MGARLNNAEEIWPEFWLDHNVILSNKIQGILLPSSYSLLLPFAKGENRELAADGYAQLIKNILTDENIIITGVAEDYKRADEILKRLKN